MYKGGGHEAEVDDIIGIFDVLDTRDALRSTTFAAANLDLLPKFGPEEINLAAIVDRQARTDAIVENMATTVQQLAAACTSTETTSDNIVHAAVRNSLADMHQKLDAFTVSMNARVDQFNTICAKLQSTNSGPQRSAQSDPGSADRKNLYCDLWRQGRS